MADPGKHCPICDATALELVLRLERVPALTNVLWPSAESARRAPMGGVELLTCLRCGHLFNAAFDPSLVDYSPAYENSIHFSSAFQSYIDILAERLVDRYRLQGKKIVEIGCGSGDFLAAICELGPNQGVGYDPSHDPARAPLSGSGRVQIIAEAFPELSMAADFVTSRHVLEHVLDPLGFVSKLRRSLGADSTVPVYFEVPDATYMLEELAIWDVIHEHRSYFTAPVLADLFVRAGFEPTHVDRSFDDQYLWIEAVPSPGPRFPDRSDIPDPDVIAMAGALHSFGSRFTTTVESWKERLAKLGPRRLALWGAGAKGVMFLNLVDPEGLIGAVVDINPHKHGGHVPGTGQQVVGLTELKHGELDHVLVMNPTYKPEVERMLLSAGLECEVLTP